MRGVQILSNQAEADKLASIDRKIGYETIMSTVQARRVIWERFEVMAVYQAAPNQDHGTLAFNEGKRCNALQLMSDLIAHVPELYDLMVKENRERLLREANDLKTGSDE